MYTDYFRLKQPPFSIAPDPRYLFMSERHREALAHLLYGIDGGGGVVLLTGEIGTGKTTLCRSLLEQIPANCNVAYVFNPKLTVTELLESICAEFAVVPAEGEDRGGTRAWVDALNRYLLAQHGAGRNNVLLIDEAQNLAPDVLEQLRLLTNLETNERKLLQIILIGQPELRTMLAEPRLEQLAQRVIAHYHLGPLNEQETASYVQHRLTVAGLSGPSPFPPAVIPHVHRLSAGVPRRINLLCDRALLGAYAEGVQAVERRILTHAASELFINQRAPATPRARWRPVAVAAGVAALALAGFAALQPARMNALLPAFASPQPVSAAPVADTGAQESAPPQAAVLPPTAPPVQQVALRSSAGEAPAPAFAGIDEERVALRQLAALWGWDETAAPPCDDRHQSLLRCFRSKGGLARLRELDRPAVLRLYDETGTPYFALLVALDEDGARLQAGAAQQQVSIAQLTRHFRGEFVTLWRSPGGTSDALSPGQQGVAVDWVGAQLAHLHGTELPAARQPYNLTLHAQVRRFQRAQGLTVDGVVGPLTFMHLNRVAGVDEPRLLGGGPAATEN